MLPIQLTPFRELHTHRLRLRRLQPDDAATLHFLRSDEASMRYIYREKDQILAQTQAHLQVLEELLAANQGITWGICQPPGTALLGAICLWNLQPANYRAEVGYTLHPAHCNRGIMSEALAAVLEFGFTQLRLHSITANVSVGNEASCRLLEKQGFVREGHLRQNYCFRGEFFDTLLYSRLAAR